MRRKCREDSGERPRIVRQLIVSRKATSILLDFIVATRARQRAQRLEQEMRQKERESDKAGGLEADKIEGDGEEEVDSVLEDRERGEEG